MSTRTYPPLPPHLSMQLEAIKIGIEGDAAYLISDECPYPDDLKVALRRLVGAEQTSDPADDVFQPGQGNDEQIDSLLGEVQQAINSMRRLQQEMDRDGVDTADKLTFFKNYGAMMERFLSLKEKGHGAKQMYEFQRVVIQTLEQVLDKDQRLDFKNRLKAVNLDLPS